MSKKHPFNVPLLPSKISQVVGRPFTKVTPRIYIYNLCIHVRSGGRGRRRLAKRHRRPHLGFEGGREGGGNRFAIKSPLNKRGTRVLETWARKIISNVHLRVHTCVATMLYARSGRVQPVNQRMSRKPTGQTGGCVIRACAHHFVCVCVCVSARVWSPRLDEGSAYTCMPARLPVRNNLEAINCGSNILEEAGSSSFRISDSRV